MNSERIHRHANGVTAWTACPVFSGISERISKNKHLPCMESRHGETAPWCRESSFFFDEAPERRYYRSRNSGPFVRPGRGYESTWPFTLLNKKNFPQGDITP